MRFVGCDEEFEHKINLDFSDAEMTSYMEQFKAENAMRLHELAAKHPRAAAQVVRFTFVHTIATLLNVPPVQNTPFGTQWMDLVACNLEDSVFSHVSAFDGVTEPQTRKTEHMHMLARVFGYSSPKMFFQATNFVERFRELWLFVASLALHSSEVIATLSFISSVDEFFM